MIEKLIMVLLIGIFVVGGLIVYYSKKEKVNKKPPSKKLRKEEENRITKAKAEAPLIEKKSTPLKEEVDKSLKITMTQRNLLKDALQFRLDRLGSGSSVNAKEIALVGKMLRGIGGMENLIVLKENYGDEELNILNLAMIDYLSIELRKDFTPSYLRQLILFFIRKENLRDKKLNLQEVIPDLFEKKDSGSLSVDAINKASIEIATSESIEDVSSLGKNVILSFVCQQLSWSLYENKGVLVRDAENYLFIMRDVLSPVERGSR